MKHIHIDQYTAMFNAFLKEHGEHKETCDKSDWGDTYKEISFSDGATWNECRRADGTLEFWNSKDSKSRMVDEGAENEWLSLGGGFTIPLNEKYSKSFTRVPPNRRLRKPRIYPTANRGCVPPNRRLRKAHCRGKAGIHCRTYRKRYCKNFSCSHKNRLLSDIINV